MAAAWDSQPQGFLRAPGGAGLEECSTHVRPWKNKHRDGPCALFPGEGACTHGALFVCFLTKARGFVSASPGDRAWGRAGQGPREKERVCVCVCVCVCVLGWESGPRKKGPVVCGSVSVSVSLSGCVGGRSEACLPPYRTCLSARPASHCSVSFFLLSSVSLTWQLSVAAPRYGRLFLLPAPNPMLSSRAGSP